MIRTDIITAIGRDYLTSNLENDEFSYPKAYLNASLHFVPIKNRTGRSFEMLDIRFVKDNVSVLVETKQNFHANFAEAKKQLSAYVEYEKALTGNKIIAILANTTDDDIAVWRGVVSESNFMPSETAVRTMNEYIDFYTSDLLQNYDLQKMDNMTQYIASNIVYIRKLISKLKTE